MDKKKLLVFDEDPQVRDLLSEGFASVYDVLATRSLEEAIREITFDHPHCVLLEMDLPHKSTSMICKILKSMRDTEAVPIILTGQKPRDFRFVEATEMGAFEYIEKPFTFQQVSEIIKRAIDLPPIERRRSKRMSLKIPFVIRGKDTFDHDFEVSSVTEGISQHGLLVRLPLRIPVGEQVEVFQTEPDDSDGVAILTRARVVWNDSDGVRGPFWHGLEFLTAASGWKAT
ncbi:MAG: response regulator [Acidobacteriia bacterium]|nr:response regulator [Terriglobia bacterium]